MTKIPYFPFSRNPFEAAIEAHPLDLAKWIEPDHRLTVDLEEKTHIFKNHQNITYGVNSEAHDACIELEEELRKNLLKFHSGIYRQNGSLFSISGQEKSFSIPPSLPPLMQAALYVQEDFALMSPKAPVKLEAGANCFLSRWKLPEKLGKNIEEIHLPVPYFDHLNRSTNLFLEKLKVESPVWRSNWIIQDSPNLFCPEISRNPISFTKENVLEKTWLRIERQTLRRLPATGYVAFSIRTYLHSMHELALDPAQKELAYLTIRDLPLSTAVYKGMRNCWEELKAALQD